LRSTNEQVQSEPTYEQYKIAEYRFTVKETASGEPWLMLEPMPQNLQVLSGGFLGLRLRPGATYEEARRLATTLDTEINSITFTKL
jgi:hypothetical protein